MGLCESREAPLKEMFEYDLKLLEANSKNPGAATQCAMAFIADPEKFIEAEIAKKQHALASQINLIFERYDTNKDSKMSKAELRKMNDDYFKLAKHYVPKAVRIQMEASKEMMDQMLKQQPAEMRSMAKDQAEGQLKAIEEATTEQELKKVGEMYANPEAFTEKLFKRMDIDGDDSVDKKEFKENWIKEITAINMEACKANTEQLQAASQMMQTKRHQQLKAHESACAEMGAMSSTTK